MGQLQNSEVYLVRFANTYEGDENVNYEAIFCATMEDVEKEIARIEKEEDPWGSGYFIDIEAYKINVDEDELKNYSSPSEYAYVAWDEGELIKQSSKTLPKVKEGSVMVFYTNAKGSADYVIEDVRFTKNHMTLSDKIFFNEDNRFATFTNYYESIEELKDEYLSQEGIFGDTIGKELVSRFLSENGIELPKEKEDE